MTIETPRVSVIIATYNWSSVLRYSIKSALWQSISDIEVLVIGDGCTDDSEAVVSSFDDPRVRWHNLPENSGNQWMPNNKGLELARVPLVAYLGHDDVWHPSHLEIVVGVLEATQADAVFSVADVINPQTVEPRTLRGVAPSGQYEYNMAVSPSTLLHRVSMITDIGGWKDYRSIRRPIDVELLARAWEHKKKIVPVPELTVFKFPSATRTNSYLETPSHEQADYVRRIETDPEIRYRELMLMVCQPDYARRTFDHHFAPNEIPKPGALIESWRAIRGFVAKPELSQDHVPLHLNDSLLRDLSAPSDIVTYRDKVYLFRHHSLPDDGLFVGFGWHGLEHDEWGCGFRWVNNDAEIVVTRPTGKYNTLLVEIAPGPGVDHQPFRLYLVNEAGERVASALIDGDQFIEIPLVVPAGEGTVFKLHTDEGGRQIESDPRILNFRVWRIEWIDHEILPARDRLTHAEPLESSSRQLLQTNGNDQSTLQSQIALLQAQIAAAHSALLPMREEFEAQRALIAQLDSFRKTSGLYWLQRVRTSPKLRRWLQRR